MIVRFFLLFFFFFFLSPAQVSQIIDNSLGRLEPVFKYRGNLFFKSFDNNNNATGLYKFNFVDKSFTAVSFAENIYDKNLNYNMNPQFYENEVYFTTQPVAKLNLDQNLISLENFSSYASLTFLDKLYYLNGSENGFKDLINNWIYPNGVPENNYMGFDIRSADFVEGDMFTSVGYHPNPSFIAYSSLYRFKNTGPFIKLFEDPNIAQYNGFGAKAKPLFANKKLLYHYNTLTNGTYWKFLSIDTNNNDIKPNLLTNAILAGMPLDYLLLHDGFIIAGGDPMKFYKSNGIDNFVEINAIPFSLGNVYLSPFFGAPSENNNFSENTTGNSFINIGTTTYFATFENSYETVKIYKITSIDKTPELITSFTNLVYNNSLRLGLNWKGNLIFYNADEQNIYKYDGSKLSIMLSLNSISGKTKLSGATVTGLFAEGDDLFINTNMGLFQVRAEILGTKEKIDKDFSMYPNPVKDNIYFSKDVQEIEIYDLSGRIIKKRIINGNKINISDLESGTYIAKITSKEGKNYNQKLIKE